MAGHVITRYLSSLNKYKILNLSKSRLNEETVILNVFERGELVNQLKNLKPDILVNCIGILVKESEEHHSKAVYINSYLPHFLSKLGKEMNFKLIHLSTDCVFSGKKGDYTENDLKDAQDFYGRSKALGEVINNRDLTIRTSIIGPELKGNGTGLFHWFMTQDRDVNGYSNVFWTGVTTLELAKVIDKIIDTDLTNLYQLVPENKISKYKLLKLIGEIWNKKISIHKETEHIQDKSLVNTRNDFEYEVPDYRTMLIELYDWMEEWDYKFYNFQ
jgi:dTDP-4-dehydrorhamnose reductase